MTFDNLQGLAIGIIGFAVIIGVGTIVLNQLGGATANCGTVFGNLTSWNSTRDLCMFIEDGAGTQNGSGVTPTGEGWVVTNYLNGELGTSGLAGWTPAIIAITVGMMFLGYFMVRGKGKSYR